MSGFNPVDTECSLTYSQQPLWSARPQAFQASHHVSHYQPGRPWSRLCHYLVLVLMVRAHITVQVCADHKTFDKGWRLFILGTSLHLWFFGTCIYHMDLLEILPPSVWQNVIMWIHTIGCCCVASRICMRYEGSLLIFGTCVPGKLYIYLSQTSQWDMISAELYLVRYCYMADRISILFTRNSGKK